MRKSLVMGAIVGAVAYPLLHFLFLLAALATCPLMYGSRGFLCRTASPFLGWMENYFLIIERFNSLGVDFMITLFVIAPIFGAIAGVIIVYVIQRYRAMKRAA